MYQPENNQPYLGYSPQPTVQITSEMIALHVSKVFGWMFVGLLATFVSALVSIRFPYILYYATLTPVGVWGIFIAQILMVIGLNMAVSKASSSVATFLFIGYALLTGVTLSVFSLIFDTSSLLTAFFITAGIFLTMSLVGYITKKDVTRFRTVFMFGLIGLVVSSLINIIIGSSLFDFVISAIGIVLFMGLIVFDMQKIKQNYSLAVYRNAEEGGDVIHSIAILGAMQLYLDFINIFLYVLRFVGNRKK